MSNDATSIAIERLFRKLSTSGRIFFCLSRADNALAQACAAHPDQRAAHVRAAGEWKSLADEIRRGLN